MEKLKHSFQEVLMAILPMSAIILILGLTVAKFDADTFIRFFGGLIMIVVGMSLFLFSANYSMIQVGQSVGSFLIRKGKLWLIIVLGFIIGCVITVAEPDVKVLAVNVSDVSNGSVPQLLLMLVVGVGVGFFIVIAILRIIFKKNLVMILLIGYSFVFTIALFITSPTFMPVAFDAGGVTTGPLTVPFILALAVGITNTISQDTDGDNSFGMVGLASLGPILAVLILGGIY